jgi:anti-anti-sigma factor
MVVQLFHVAERARRAGYVPDAIGPIETLGRDGGVSVGLLCECTAVSLGAPPDDVIVVRVAGEVDLLTGPVLQAALADSLARGPCDLLVDLAAMTFCDVRGLSMLVQVGATAAERGVGYAVAAAPRQVRRVWPMLWPAAELPVQYPSAAAGVLAAMTRRHDEDLARWALKRGPGWSRRWPTPRLQDVPGTGSVIAERLVTPLG